MKTQDKPVEWMVSEGGIAATLIYAGGQWCIFRPQQLDPPRINFCPDGNERLQPLDEFLAEASERLDLVPVARVA